MPAPITFFDMAVSQSAPAAYVPVPVTLGDNWQPGDVRIFFQLVAWISSVAIVNPPGYTLISGGTDAGISYRRLVAGDTDTFIQYPSTTLFSGYGTALITVRGVSPTVNPTAGVYPITGLALPSASSTGGTANMTSFSVPVGAAVISVWSVTGTASNATACTLGAPSGWTNLVASDGSGRTYSPFGAQPSIMLVGKSFSSAGSTGAVPIQYGAENNAEAFPLFFTLPAAADVNPGVSTPPSTVSSVGTTTFSTSTAVTVSTGNASTTSSASTAFNPLFGKWESDPLTLPGDPVTGSVIRWKQSIPTAGSTIRVETSINNGASWDLATNNSQVPRLTTGDTTTRSVLVRFFLSRLLATDAPPRVSSLELQVSVDAGTDELVPVGHGMIDKVTVSSVGGSTGTGSVTSVVSSSAVISRGGGQTGGGKSIKIHCTDLSGAIKRNVWAMPYTVPSGTNYATAVEAMVVNRLLSQTTFALSTTTATTPLLVFGMQQGGDPWQDIQDLATAIGFEVFFDPSGVFVFRPVPDPNVGDPVWVFDENFNPLVAEVARELSNEQTFNHVIVVGQSTSSSNPVTAEAFDNNPSSPTYILGPYGEVTERLTFSTITTQDQAQAAANALLLNSLGGADTVTITVVPQPALEPGDIVRVAIADVNVDGNYMINSMTTSMSPADPQQLVCFKQSTS